MPDIRQARPAEILLIEDNPADIRLTMEAMKESKIANRLSIVRDGDEALEFLCRRGRHAGAPRPDLILLDLNLPKRDGREVLREIKSVEGLKRIPVVVLTTSGAEEDILRSYDLHANCFITKPIDLNQFIKVVQHIESFWFSVVSLPERPQA
jgi:chemotaxis family two-component system response regulator Rcp1